RALAIHERLGLKEALIEYNTLAEIARARGRAEEATEWERKCAAKLEELERRAAGPVGLHPQNIRTLQALSLACASAAKDGNELEPDAEAALAQMDGLPAPMPELARFLRGIAAGDIPALPASTPAELRSFFEQLLTALREAKS